MARGPGEPTGGSDEPGDHGCLVFGDQARLCHDLWHKPCRQSAQRAKRDRSRSGESWGAGHGELPAKFACRCGLQTYVQDQVMQGSAMDEQLPDTTRCYAAGCNRENEILMHLSENPTAFADLCWEHAHEAFRSTPLTWTCDCAFCQRARSVLGGSRAGDAASDAAEPVTQGEHEHPADMLLCPACQPGEWIIETASASQYVLDSRDRSAVTVVRLPDAGGGTDLALRRDGDPIRLVESSIVRREASWYLILDLRRDGVLTQRITSPVLSVRPLVY